MHLKGSTSSGCGWLHWRRKDEMIVVQKIVLKNRWEKVQNKFHAYIAYDDTSNHNKKESSLFVGFGFAAAGNSTHWHSQHVGGRWIEIRRSRFQCIFWFLRKLKYWAWNLDRLISIQHHQYAKCVNMWIAYCTNPRDLIHLWSEMWN
jgi:hypothetical protein